jgi:hypothetical protein
LLEKATKDELEKSILSGDQTKENRMRYLIQALPFHSDEIVALEELAKKTATTRAPLIEPEIPVELKKLLKDYGLIDKDGKAVEIVPLPVSPDAENPSVLLTNDKNKEPSLLLEDIHEEVQKSSSLVKAEDYENFKPIKDSKNVSSDMESFLKQFGLMDVVDDSRKTKSIKSSKVSSNSNIPTIDSAYLIPGYTKLLNNIGITTIKDKEVKKTMKNNFKQVNKNKAEEEDYKKLDQLLETIRELEKLNASLTEKEVNRLNLQNFNFSESLLSDGPDPKQYQAHYSALKNTIKRQNSEDEPTKISLGLTGPLLESSLEATDDAKATDEDSSTNEGSSTSSTTTTTESTTTTTEESSSEPQEEEKKNSLEDEIEPVEDPEPLPPPRRSGFYMLFDWNSFLEVGEDPDKVVIRFDPKIGDPTRFLPVNVP